MKNILALLAIVCLSINVQAQLLWKISGNGLKQPSYIFGTHHLAPIHIKDSIKGFSKAFEETQQVYGELKMLDVQSPEVAQKMKKIMFIDNDSTIQSLLSSEDYEKVNKFCKENLMFDLASVPKIKPNYIVNNIVVISYIKHIGNFNLQEQLDTYLQKAATEKGKKTFGLETYDFQFDLLYNSMPLKRQVVQLMCVLNHIEKAVNDLKELTAAYINQDLNKMEQISNERMNNECDPLPGEKERMIDNRNKKWAEQMPSIMKETPTFFAVGALHLAGNNGVISLLKKQGYKVDPIK